MPPIATAQIFLSAFLLSFWLHFPCISAWTCQNSCGSVALNYPFGYGWNCGSPSFQSYVNCSQGNLLFYTPTGTYTVQSIDYVNNIMIVHDPSMSTCSSMRESSAFGLPINSPFSFASYDTIALIGCSSTSSLYSSQSCDPSTSQICQSLYNCPGINQLGLMQNSETSSCCVYSSSRLTTAPYDIDLPLLQCSSYISTYHIGNVADPESTWLYGIALQFNSGSSQSPPASKTPYSSCYVCQQAEESRGSLDRVPDGALQVGGLAMILGALFMTI